MKTLGYALSVLTALLLAGSLLGGFAALVWLLVLAEWALVGLGAGLAVATALLAPLLLVPARALAAAASDPGAGEGRIALAAFLANAYSAAVLAACLLAFLWLLFHAPDPAHPLPAAVWSYAVATLPWLWLAYRQDRATGGDAGGAALLVVAGMVAYVAAVLSSHYGGLSLAELGGVMLALLGFGAVLNASRARRPVGGGAGGG